MAVDDRGGGLVLLPQTYATDAAAQPASRTLLARLQLQGSDGLAPLQLGAMAALRRYDGGAGRNQVAGPDLDWKLGGGWRARLQWLQSDTTAQPVAGPGLQRLAASPATRGPPGACQAAVPG